MELMFLFTLGAVTVFVIGFVLGYFLGRDDA